MRFVRTKIDEIASHSLSFPIMAVGFDPASSHDGYVNIVFRMDVLREHVPGKFKKLAAL